MSEIPIDKAVMEKCPQRPGARGRLRLERRRRLAGARRALPQPTTAATRSRAHVSPSTRATRSSSPTTAAWSRPWASRTWSSSSRAGRPWSPGKTSSTSSRGWSRASARPGSGSCYDRERPGSPQRHGGHEEATQRRSILSNWEIFNSKFLTVLCVPLSVLRASVVNEGHEPSPRDRFRDQARRGGMSDPSRTIATPLEVHERTTPSGMPSIIAGWSRTRASSGS